MKRSRSLLAPLLSLLAAACGGGDKHLELGGTCTLNSDCKDPLVCKLGACHQACMQTRDCPTGERCVQVDTIGVCQQPDERQCKPTSPKCATPLVCAADNVCRNSCTTGSDCLANQECLANVCLEATEAAAWRMDGGVRSDGSTTVGQDGSTGGGKVDGGAPDVTPATSDVGSSPGVDGAVASDLPPAGQTDAPTVVEDAPTVVGDAPQIPDLKPTDWGPGAIDASITVTAVAEPTSARPGEEITITVAGAGVTDPKNLTLGGVLADKVTISEATSVSFKAKLTVPHGLAPAIVDLGFSCQGGQATASAVLQVTAISVSIDGDDANRGIPGSPFRTVTKAIQTAGVGDTIQVGSGEFSEGETWPALPHKATLVGAGVNSTLFHRPGTGYVNLGFVGDAIVRDLALTGVVCGFEITKPHTAVRLENVAIPKVACLSGSNDVFVSPNATGAQVTIGGELTWLSKQVYVAATNVSLVLRDGMIGGVYAIVTGTNLRVEGATLGNLLEPRSSAVINLLTANVVLDHAMLNGEMAVDSGSTVEATASTFKPSTNQVGLSSRYAGSTYVSRRGSGVGRLKAMLTNCTFDGGGTQLQVAKDDDVVIRGCKFLNYEQTGVYVLDEPAKLDLGTGTDSGGNEFSSTKGTGVYGYQDDRAAAGQTVTISGTSFNGVTPPAGMLTKSATETACEPGAYCIKTEGNSITFY